MRINGTSDSLIHSFLQLYLMPIIKCQTLLQVLVILQWKKKRQKYGPYKLDMPLMVDFNKCLTLESLAYYSQYLLPPIRSLVASRELGWCKLHWSLWLPTIIWYKALSIKAIDPSWFICTCLSSQLHNLLLHIHTYQNLPWALSVILQVFYFPYCKGTHASPFPTQSKLLSTKVTLSERPLA